MTARHLFVTGLMLVAGALFTWAMASGLQQYAIDRHAASNASVAGATLAPSLHLHKAAESHWMF
jgi:hypothetical protein